MKNNDKYRDEFYRAFDAINSPDNRTKQRIFNSVMNKERKINFKMMRVAVPAALLIMISANTVMISNALNRNHNGETNNSQNTVSETQYSEISVTTVAPKELIYSETSADFTGIYTSVPETSQTTALTLHSDETAQITSTSEKIYVTETSFSDEINVPATELPVQEDAEETTPQITDNISSDVTEGELLPPVSLELQSFFSEAYDVYKQVTLGGYTMFIDSDENNDYSAENNVDIDGRIYSRTSQKYFSTMQDVKDYFRRYFTDDFISLMDIYSHFIEYDDRIYVETGGKGGIIGYAGHIYQITSQTDSEIDIDVDCYVCNDMNNFDDTMIFHTPEDMSKYDTLERQIIFKKVNGEWRVDKVELMW